MKLSRAWGSETRMVCSSATELAAKGGKRKLLTKLDVSKLNPLGVSDQSAVEKEGSSQ